MSLYKERHQLNKRFPIRLALLNRSIKLNLAEAKKQLHDDARKTKKINLLIHIATDDLNDLEYSLKKGIMRELHIEFTKKGSHYFSSGGMK